MAKDYYRDGKRTSLKSNSSTKEVEFIYIMYNSEENRHCMANTLMNISQNPMLSATFLHYLLPIEVMDYDNGNDLDCFTNKTLINALVHLGIISGPNKSRSLPNDDNINSYVRHFDESNENIDDFAETTKNATFIVLHLKLFSEIEPNNDDFHFVPLLKFHDEWVLMGGEKGSEIRAIADYDLPTMLFTQVGREKIRTHCQKPFPGMLMQFQEHLTCIVPLHMGPAVRASYYGQDEKDLDKKMPWTRVYNTKTNFRKDHAYMMMMMEGDEVTKLTPS